jgi:hypothetical protein
LPDADFAGFPIDEGLLSNGSWDLVARVGDLSYELAEQDTSDLRVYAQPPVACMLLLGFSGDWEAAR